jgi:hypothetical protein
MRTVEISPSGVLAEVEQEPPRKSPVANFLASAFLPGSGTAIAGNPLRGAVIFFVCVGTVLGGVILTSAVAAQGQPLVSCALISSCPQQHQALAGDLLLLAAVFVWLCQLIESVSATRAWNRDQQPRLLDMERNAIRFAGRQSAYRKATADFPYPLSFGIGTVGSFTLYDDEFVVTRIDGRGTSKKRVLTLTTHHLISTRRRMFGGVETADPWPITDFESDGTCLREAVWTRSARLTIVAGDIVRVAEFRSERQALRDFRNTLLHMAYLRRQLSAVRPLSVVGPVAVTAHVNPPALPSPKDGLYSADGDYFWDGERWQRVVHW